MGEWSWASVVATAPCAASAVSPEVRTNLSTRPGSTLGGQVDKSTPTSNNVLQCHLDDIEESASAKKEDPGVPDAWAEALARVAPDRPIGVAIVAPVDWFERVAAPLSSEPSLEHPWPPRRGRVEEQGGVLLHFCVVCGAWGAFGFDVDLRAGRRGRWFCRAHRPHFSSESAV